MAENLARQLIAEHLIEGEVRPDAEIALKIDQLLMHDGTGPLCALQLEAMGVEQVPAANDGKGATTDTVAPQLHRQLGADSRPSRDDDRPAQTALFCGCQARSMSD
jgi:homoaconitase/3-isopropylmalate dehydratase large subunit